jgi:Ca2+-dependent lipid-binding protein
MPFLSSRQTKDVDYGKQRSTTKNDQLNPVWGETFTFNIPTLDNMVLTCKLRDEDQGSRDDKMGWCKFKLENLGLTATPKEFEKVVDRNIGRSNGKIHLKLSYRP